jgi:hypothetical protein
MPGLSRPFFSRRDAETIGKGMFYLLFLNICKRLADDADSETVITAYGDTAPAGDLI